MDSQGKKFDLKEILIKLVSSITNYTEIYLIAISPRLIHFAVRWIITNKHKNYRIICTPEQAYQFTAFLSQQLEHFPIKKINMNILNEKDGCCVQEEQFWKEFKNLINKTTFDQILVEQLHQNVQRMLQKLMGGICSKKLTFANSMGFDEISTITTLIHKDHPKFDVNVVFNARDYHLGDLLTFLEEWVTSLPQQPVYAVKPPQVFGFPFPLSNEPQLTTNRREQISILCKEKQVITVKQLNNLSCQIIFHGNIGEQLLYEISSFLLKINRMMSLQINSLQGNNLVQFIKFVVEHYEQRDYRICIGHQVELTPSRIILNTTGLTQEQVLLILLIMRKPGHYQFICYSSSQHLPAAIELFRHKPLVKFNFFLPLQESQHYKLPIQKMEKHANELLLRVYTYSGLLKNLSHKGYLVVNSVFSNFGD